MPKTLSAAWGSWVSRNELASIFHFSLVCEAVRGSINADSPYPVTNVEFTETLARILGCKPLLAILAWLMRLMLGEMADALAVASRRIEPRRLLDAGYSFRFPDLDTALCHELAGIHLVKNTESNNLCK